MTRAEAWLTGVGAVLALVPVAVFGAVLWREGDRGAVAGFVPLMATPAVLALAALTLPERPPARAALTTAAACLLLPISLLTYFLAVPALATMTAAAVVTRSHRSAEGESEWPLAAMIPVVVVFWLAALAVYLADGTRSSCGESALPDGVTHEAGGCAGSIEVLGMIAVAALLALMAALVLQLIRSDRARTVLR